MSSERCVSPSMLPEELQQSPTFNGSFDVKAVLPAQSKALSSKSTKVAKRALVPERPATVASTDLLANVSGIGVDEEYSNDEEMLNNFIKLHPMLSLQATSTETLQLISETMQKAHVKIPELEAVPKSHDDLFLWCENDDP